ATAFLAVLPLHRVVQIHLSGGHDEDGYRVDSHSTPTPEPVWDLFRFTASRTPINAVIIEWDERLPAFAVMQHEVDRARAILRGEGAALSCGPSAHAVAGNGGPLSWAASADAVAGERL